MRIVFMIFLMLMLAISAVAVQELMSFQGDVRQAGVAVNNGNLSVEIFDAASGGNLIYNGTFNNSVNSGRFDVVLGNETPDLLMNFSQLYYLDFYVNGNKITTTRQSFQNGMVRGLFVDVGRYAIRMNFNTAAPGLYATAMGQATNASGQSSLAMGANQGAGQILTGTSAVGAFAGGNANGPANILSTNIGSFAFGSASNPINPSTIAATAEGAVAAGHASGGNINATGQGSIAVGTTDDAANSILSTATGSLAGGRSSGVGSTNLIQASGDGAIAYGDCEFDGGIAQIIASNSGSFAQGYSAGSGAVIRASSTGAFAQGHSSGGNINATNTGARAQGYVDGTGDIIAGGAGSVAQGASVTTGLIQSSNSGAFSQGYAAGSGNITSSGLGSHAEGYANNGIIDASGQGSIAFGYSRTGYIRTLTNGGGALAGGYATDGNGITADQQGSFAHGIVSGGGTNSIRSTADGAFAHGAAKGVVQISMLEAAQEGAAAFGYIETGRINSSGYGSFAAGQATGDGRIIAANWGSIAMGNVEAGIVSALGKGSVALGSAGPGTITAEGEGALAAGYTDAVTEVTNASGAASVAIGRNVRVDSDHSFAFGRNLHLNDSYTAGFFNASSPGVLMVNRRDSNSSHVIVGGEDGDANSGSGAYLSKAGVWTDASSRTFKEDYQKIDKQSLLNDIDQLEIFNWKYKGNDARHIGPFAEDIYYTFGVGEEQKYLASMDVAGITMAAVQELIKQNKELKAENEKLAERLTAIEQLLANR